MGPWECHREQQRPPLSTGERKSALYFLRETVETVPRRQSLSRDALIAGVGVDSLRDMGVRRILFIYLIFLNQTNPIATVPSLSPYHVLRFVRNLTCVILPFSRRVGSREKSTP